MSRKDKRFLKSRLYVGTRLQNVILFYFFSAIIVTTILSVLIAYFWFADPEPNGFVYFGGVFIYFFLVYFSALFLSNKIGGPLFRLTKHLEEIAQGQKKPGPIRFRPGDHCGDIAEALSRVIKSTSNIDE